MAGCTTVLPTLHENVSLQKKKKNFFFFFSFSSKDAVLILMRTISALRRQDPILGIASADKGGALDVLGAARDL